MTATTTPDATIPRDVRDMHRGQLEAEVVRLRSEAELMLATARDNETTLQDVRDVFSRQRTMMHFAEREYLEMAANLTATQARCTELLNEVRELRARAIALQTVIVDMADDVLGVQPVAETDDDVAALVHAVARAYHEERRTRSQLEASGITLPGWTCPDCRAFNGEAKERLLICRACTTPRPKVEQSVAGGIVESTRGTR